MTNDSVKKTLLVAFLLCVVCALLVAGSTVLLRPKQKENKELDITKNLLSVTGLIQSNKISKKISKDEVKEAFKKITVKILDLSTTQLSDKPEVAIKKQDPKLVTIYFVKENNTISQIVLPIQGKGLWSTLYGFIALAPDTVTVKGLNFYQHGETPGLGGEIDNPAWKALWPGKKVLDPDKDFAPVLTVVRGKVGEGTEKAENKIDGLSGATITSRGVQDLVNYWLGKDGFGKFLAKFRSGEVRL